ncbi:MAG: IS21 family transposase [Desulfobacterales bacterium]|nr:IS21 family transposase [Desulfobacterales bacterium]
MINKRMIFEIHRLKNMGMSNREIAKASGCSRKTVAKYISNPELKPSKRKGRTLKLAPYHDYIRKLIIKYPKLKAPVVLRQIEQKGFDGEISILRDFLRKIRGQSVTRQAYSRFESNPGQQMQVDWGHFGAISYGKTKRKLYGLAVIESHSRMLYVSFTHSQKQEALHQALFDAFKYFGGTPDELVVDNMLTAVTERAGSLIRFNDNFLEFLLPFGIKPVACNIRSPHEKGKIERSIHYIRHNFLPLKKFNNLPDLQSQAMKWLNTIANTRTHNTTGEIPVKRLQRGRLKKLPDIALDYREIHILYAHKDFALRFDSNTYTVPVWAIGKTAVLKANQEKVWIYYKTRCIAVHARSWEKKQRIELESHKSQLHKLRKRRLADKNVLAFLSLGQTALDYLNELEKTGSPLKKDIIQIMTLKDEYGDSSIIIALNKALDLKLYGADYIQNILYQKMTPKTCHPPVRLKEDRFNEIRLCSPNLAEYDALVLKKRKKT